MPCPVKLVLWSNGLIMIFYSAVPGSMPSGARTIFFFFFAVFLFVCLGIQEANEEYRAFVQNDKWASATTSQKEINDLKQALKSFLEQPWYKGKPKCNNQLQQ